MILFLQNYWSDLLLSIVGLSAFVVYFIQKRDKKRAAATLILGQIDSIEKRVVKLKEDNQLGNPSVYNTQAIIKENMWEQYKHLFVKELSSPEYEIVQRFFDYAEQIERTRVEIVGTITTAWKDKSLVEHQIIGNLVVSHIENWPQHIQEFQDTYRPMDLVFTPDIAIKSLTRSLSNFDMLTGSTAYQKIQKFSFKK